MLTHRDHLEVILLCLYHRQYNGSKEMYLKDKELFNRVLSLKNLGPLVEKLKRDVLFIPEEFKPRLLGPEQKEPSYIYWFIHKRRWFEKAYDVINTVDVELLPKIPYKCPQDFIDSGEYRKKQEIFVTQLCEVDRERVRRYFVEMLEHPLYKQ